MKFIRHIIIALAFIAVFIWVSVFYSTEYSGDKIDLSVTEDKSPAVKVALNGLSQLLSYADKIPMLNFLPVAKIGANYEIEATKDIYHDLKANVENKYNVGEDVVSLAPVVVDSSIKSISWSDIVNKVKTALSKDWFRH